MQADSDSRAEAAADDDNLKTWEAVFRNRSWGRYPPEELIRFVMRRFGKAQDRRAVRILELGCGPGANVWFLRYEGFSVASVEGSPTAVAQARTRLEREGLYDPACVDLRVGNFRSLPFADASFDAVIDVEAITHNRVPVIEEVLAEARRVLKPGGGFFSKFFGIQTTGYGSGEMLDTNTCANVAFGPLANFGLVTFASRPLLERLFAPFGNVSFDWAHWTSASATAHVFEWVITAEKRG